MRKDIICLLGLGLSLYLLVAVFFFSPLGYPDLSSNGYTSQISVKNITMSLGYLLHINLGWTSIILPIVVIFWAFLLYFYNQDITNIKLKILSLILFLFSFAGFISILTLGNEKVAFYLSGLIGFFIQDLSQKYFGKAGSLIVLFSTSLLLAIVVTDLPLLSYLLMFFKKIFNLFKKAVFKLPLLIFGRNSDRGIISPVRKKVVLKKRDFEFKERKIHKEDMKLDDVPIVLNQKQKEKRGLLKQEKLPEVIKPQSKEGFILPPIDLLRHAPLQKDNQIKEDLRAKANLLEETLRDFGIEARVVNIEKGPVITRYELQPAPGVKVQWIASLSEDIGLVMKSYNIHVATIPGKGTVGVEVPNTTTSLVCLREIIASKEFQNHSSLLALALGQKVTGEPLISDLADMPHLLIAGATGSGKTVCINALITSILYRATPDEVRLILIDPKMVEMASFNDLPHLVIPVVTNANQAISALEWAVNEMDSRYKLLSRAVARNIDGYNMKKGKDSDLPESLPYIVVIIDELADLMLVASKEIESCIARLAQLSRAVGIHMILATQRPSVDVITGVIKANFSSRISFQVASKVDSRTVLDMNGADKLIGKGDLLFIPPGTSKPCRAQGTLISDKEIDNVVAFIKNQRQPDYNQEILSSSSKTGGLKSPGKRDALYDEAVNIIMQTGQASVSILQRRLGVGYTRAARLIDMMEEDGIVGTYQGSKPREILSDREEYLRNNNNS
ncbi:MAG: DNA translocase FtsK 4TM domain-containing protein [Candidatus Saelkia tenebricola]|nr:DNA translocase FtsK 4TM domain-containing protein [Candidatus Saelkia tenebricola]